MGHERFCTLYKRPKRPARFAQGISKGGYCNFRPLNCRCLLFKLLLRIRSIPSAPAVPLCSYVQCTPGDTDPRLCPPLLPRDRLAAHSLYMSRPARAPARSGNQSSTAHARTHNTSSSPSHSPGCGYAPQVCTCKNMYISKPRFFIWLAFFISVADCPVSCVR